MKYRIVSAQIRTVNSLYFVVNQPLPFDAFFSYKGSPDLNRPIQRNRIGIERNGSELSCEGAYTGHPRAGVSGADVADNIFVGIDPRPKSGDGLQKHVHAHRLLEENQEAVVRKSIKEHLTVHSGQGTLFFRMGYPDENLLVGLDFAVPNEVRFTTPLFLLLPILCPLLVIFIQRKRRE